MSLLTNLNTMGHLTEALFHFNYALDIASRNTSKVETARTYFDGLNKLQTQWLMSQTDQKMGEVKTFQTMISCGLASDAKDAFLRSPEIQCLVSLSPKIMNHDVLRRGGYRPDVEIEQPLVIKASEVHQKLENAYRSFQEDSSEEICERVIKRVAELLYVVRSNIAHGEKTPYGPDLKKRERDENVCACIVPLQELLLDMLLGQPSKKLISYGSLMPGQPNHVVVSDLEGEWQDCVIRGTINKINGLSRFSWNPTGPELSVCLFTSDDLSRSWERIDRFEGKEYRRQLIPAKIKIGIAIAYVYIDA